MACVCVKHKHVDALFSSFALFLMLYVKVICTLRAELFPNLCNTWGQECVKGARILYLILLPGHN